jgi:hypothetical protein
MSDIETILNSSNFSDSQKSVLSTIIQVISDENNILSEEKKLFIGQMLFAIFIWKGDVNLVSWCIDNNYGSASALITNSHISLANQLGFNMETISDMGVDRNSPDNIQQI